MNISGSVRLNIETYLAGKNQPTHPAVIAFKETWNGFKYWMVYSPYPYSNGEEENPCIAVSNDLFDWRTPEGLVNPIATNEELACDELKDPHILYREDLNRIEVWYLGRLGVPAGGDGKTLLIFRKYSLDGRVWSPYEVLTSTDYLSPSVMYRDGKYCMWEIGFPQKNTQGSFIYRESIDGFNWEEPTYCSIGGNSSGLKIWHGSVTWNERKEKYEFVYIEDSMNCGQIMYCESTDATRFSDVRQLLKIDVHWRAFYRPFLLWDGCSYTCIYGVINRDNSWYLSMNYGESLDKLSALSIADEKKMKPLSDVVIDTTTIKYRVKEIGRFIKNMQCIETIVFAPLLSIVNQQALLFVAAVLVSTLYIAYKNRSLLSHNKRILVKCIIAGILNGFYVLGGAIALKLFL